MMQRRLCIHLAAAATLTPITMLPAFADTPAPAEVSSALPQARLQGSGVLRFFGLRVYEARLWTAPSFVAADYARQPFALELIYDRRLEGQAIAERSVAEMRRVGPFDEATAKRWRSLMVKAFPDVVASDRLLGLHDGQGDVSFFHNGKLTAQLVDADYARLFFGIWLSQQSSAPALRDALLGLAR
ncbi:chalcone isomerase family protein [Roseateles sp.]|uniref:chalcone isomerase family protein n=1 Tax=Roseateles sp. TaxID=1971397 RepID=UPI0039C974EF